MAEQMMQHKADKMAAKQTIPTGYKQTEVGVIPEDWDVVPFFDAISIASGQVSPLVEPYASMTLVAPDHIEARTGRLLAKESAKEQKAISGKYYFLSDDTVYSKIRPYLRKAAFVDFDGLCSADMYPLRAKSRIEPKLILPLILDERFSSYTESVSVRSGMPKINRAELADFSFALPRCKNEQAAIAIALSDSDALIESLEQLIAKKQAIKTAAMQQLLTGRTRLPQFALRPDGTPKGYKSSELGDIPEDWEIKQIIQFTDCTAGGTPSTSIASYWGGEHPWMSSGELHLKRVFDVSVRITDEGLGNSSTKYVPADSVLIGLAGQGKTRGTVAIAKIPLCTNQSIASVFPSAEHCPEFLFYNLDSRYEELRELSTGDGGRGGLNLAIIRRLKVIFPDKTEQSAIANVLSDMDSELTELEQKLAKARDVKQGMMQQLLTGRIRLPLEVQA